MFTGHTKCDSIKKTISVYLKAQKHSAQVIDAQTLAQIRKCASTCTSTQVQKFASICASTKINDNLFLVTDNTLHVSMLKFIPQIYSKLKDFRCLAVVKHNQLNTIIKNTLRIINTQIDRAKRSNIWHFIIK